MELIFSVFDKDDSLFCPPYIARSVVSAEKQFRASLDAADRGKYPHEFALYQVGTFNSSTGEISGVVPVLVCEEDKE